MLNKRFSGIVGILTSLKGDFALDGELVALDAQGRPSFQVLQNNLSRSLPVYFYCFDLLNRDDETLVNLPIRQRREFLHRMFSAPQDRLRLSPLLQAPSGQVLEAVRKLGLEGVVGKRIDSIYEPGERSGAWIKHRANMEQEFVIGGYVPGARGFDALLVGVYEKKDLDVRREGEERLRITNPGRSLPDAQGVANCPVPVQESAREEGITVGRVVNRRENGPMRLGQTEAGLPGRIRRMDRCRTFKALHLHRNARRQEAGGGGSGNLSSPNWRLKRSLECHIPENNDDETQIILPKGEG